MKINNLKVYKKANYKAKALVFAGILGITGLFTGCNKQERKQEYNTITEIVDKNKEEGFIDENLDVMTLTEKDNPEKLNFNQVSKLYDQHRVLADIDENKLEDCNKYMYIMQKMVLESIILETASINLNDINDVDLDIYKKNNKYVGSLTYRDNNSNFKRKNYEFAENSIGEKIAKNTIKAKNNNLSLNNIDNAYNDLANTINIAYDTEVHSKFFNPEISVIDIPNSEKKLIIKR